MEELRIIKQDKETIYQRMFDFEVKGIEDWQKHLRIKFTEDEKMIGPWYQMVCYLTGQSPQKNMTSRSMVEAVRSTLYAS